MESKLVGNVEDVAELPGVGQIHRQDVGSTSCIQNIWTIVTESGLKSSRDINFSKVHRLNISDNPIKLHKKVSHIIIKSYFKLTDIHISGCEEREVFRVQCSLS